jgi:hypothetical protein
MLNFFKYSKDIGDLEIISCLSLKFITIPPSPLLYNYFGLISLTVRLEFEIPQIIRLKLTRIG